MAKTEYDSMPGKRGAAIVWHPLFKKYYAAMAGNGQFPLCVFSPDGKRISTDDLTCQNDVRGLWYNAKKKAIEGNAYADGGWFRYTTDNKGMITGSEILQEDQHQPTEQCVGTYLPSLNYVVFLDGSMVRLYSAENGEIDESVRIHWGTSEKEGISDDEEDDDVTDWRYNYTTVVYTGIKKAELGFLNHEEGRIELYDIATGFLTKIVELPVEAPINEAFNFSYTNGTFWLFDMENRTWLGYK